MLEITSCACVFLTRVNVYTVRNCDQLRDGAQLAELLDNILSGPIRVNVGPDSWLLLEHKEQGVPSSKPIGVI